MVFCLFVFLSFLFLSAPSLPSFSLGPSLPITQAILTSSIFYGFCSALSVSESSRALSLPPFWKGPCPLAMPPSLRSFWTLQLFFLYLSPERWLSRGIHIQHAASAIHAAVSQFCLFSTDTRQQCGLNQAWCLPLECAPFPVSWRKTACFNSISIATYFLEHINQVPVNLAPKLNST